MKTLVAALELAEEGLAIFPARPDKAPYIKDPKNNATINSDQIIKWWLQFPNALIGLPTGKRNGLLVIDIDNKEGQKGYESLKQLEALHGSLPGTYTVTTPGGLHIYFRYPLDAGITIGAGALGPNLDHRGEGGYVIAEGSVLSDDVQYAGCNDAPIAEAPAWLIDLLKKKETK